MDVSVVIPLYNGEEWIDETIQSILAQIHRPQEIIVVDDGSTDDSPEIARSYADVTLLHNPGNGTGAARNHGFQHTSAPLVAFVDQDDLWHPTHLSLLVRLLQDNRYPAACAGIDKFESGATPNYDVGLDDLRRENGLHADAEEFLPWDRYPLNTIHTPSCVLVRRNALNRIGGWPTQFTISDINAWFKLGTEKPLLQSNKVTVGKRVHSKSYLRTLRTEKALSYLEDHIRSCEDALAFRKTVRPDETENYQDRLDVFEAVGGVFEGVLYENKELFADSIKAWEETSIDQELEEEIVSFVLWLFRREISEAPAQQSVLLNRIVREWPDSCPHARTVLDKTFAQTSISGWSFLSCLSQNPHRIRMWPLFYEAMKTRMRRRTDFLN